MCALFLNLLAMLSISRLHQKLPRLSKDTAIGYKTSQVRSQSRCLQLHVFIHYDSNLCTFADVWVINYKYIVHLHPDRNLLIKCSYFGLEEDRVLYEQAWLVRELVLSEGQLHERQPHSIRQRRPRINGKSWVKMVGDQCAGWLGVSQLKPYMYTLPACQELGYS